MPTYRVVPVVFAIVIWGWSPALFPQDQAGNATNTARVNEEYLIGWMGAAQVIVLHDYLGLVAEQTAEPPGKRLERVNFVTEHTQRLMKQLDALANSKQPVPEQVAYGRLIGLLQLIRDESVALKRVVTSPSPDARLSFSQVQRDVDNQLRQLRSSSPVSTTEGADGQTAR